MARKFTPEQANKTLPLVRLIVADILLKGRLYRELQCGNNDGRALEQLERVHSELHELVHELEKIGCLFKDVHSEFGLVDFPAEINGLDVELCWRSDESSVAWYHTCDGGYAQRQPIPTELYEQA
ncbi:MAG: DUF2203 domain-containing protein [Planctomycetota bacterium]